MELKPRLVEKEDRENLGNRCTRCGVSAFGDMDRVNRVDPQPVGNIFIKRIINSPFDFLLGYRL